MGFQGFADNRFSAAAFATSIGSLVGIVAGFKGGWIDEALMRISDISLSIPALALMILFVFTYNQALARFSLQSASQLGRQ